MEDNIIDEEFINMDDKENIINQANTILDYGSIDKIMNAKLNDKVCKIKLKIKLDNEIITGTASGFFCYIPSKKMKVLITNNHVINQTFLDNENKLIFSIEIDKKEIEKEINLEYQRYKYTNAKKDFTIIEILDEDNIESFFEIDENALGIGIGEKKQIFSIQYPKGENLKISLGIISKEKLIFKNPELQELNNISFAYDIGTEAGSSGSPIISEDNLRVIGLHKGASKNKKYNLGIYLNNIIEIIPKKEKNINENVIYCKYEINEELVNKKIKIFDNTNNIMDYIYKVIINKKEEEKEKIKNGKYRFKEKGIIFVEYHIKENTINLNKLFYECNYLKEVNFPSLINNQITNMSRMLEKCSLLEKITFSPLFTTKKVLDMSYMFSKCENLKDLNFESFNTISVKNMSNMFNGCKLLEKLDLSNFETENVEDMSYMFCDCIKLQEINLKSFNTVNVTNMGHMFSLCPLENLDLSNFNTKNVKCMTFMFSFCKNLENLDLSSFNTENVEDMSFMFGNCENLEQIDLSSFNTANAKNMSNMFSDCKSLENLDLMSFNIDEKVKINGMFKNCEKLSFIKSNNELINNEYKGIGPTISINPFHPEEYFQNNPLWNQNFFNFNLFQ